MGSHFLDNYYMPTDDMDNSFIESNSETCSVDSLMPDSVQTQPIFLLNEIEIEEQCELDKNLNALDNLVQLSFETFIEGAIKLQGDVSKVTSL